ncbi:uncharacterized protein LOC130677302 [Microplitis mediator]|uniref:uncharacterized protein LOC130677302 n=1 Tax=Microplitis mediator TaxID=375433 RepID=UPI002556C789|nr:uncharacterized protein LOC130677302 [Microplitis mediator]
MSVYVTVNPVCVRREKSLLSDREQIKKFERERRRRLRIEQVRQQSKDISSNLLERTKDIARKELDQLEKNKDSELRRMHNKKINEIHQRYQDEMDNIGLAHDSATIQPQSQVILEAEKYRNNVAAVERAKEASQLINHKRNEPSAASKQHQRLRKVREVENVRSAIISSLPAKATRDPPVTSVKKRKTVKKSPVKTRVKSPQQVIVEIHQEQQESEDDISQPADTVANECLCADCCTCIYSKQSDFKYNPDDYRQRPHDHVDLVSTTSVSDDSSYFSDIPPQTTSIPTTKSTTRPTTSSRSKTPGTRDNSNVVERIISVEGELNAQDAAREVAKEIITQSNDNVNKSRRRGADALLREKVKRDYNNLIKNLDTLSREEKKLKASKINDAEIRKSNEYRERDRGKAQAELRTKRIEKARQKLMDHDLDAILPDQRQNQVAEKIITLPRNKKTSKSPVRASWELPVSDPQDQIYPKNQDKRKESSRDEQILEMLEKVERQKKLLLLEFGASLPNDIFDASMTPLFNNISNKSKTVEDSTDQLSKTVPAPVPIPVPESSPAPIPEPIPTRKASPEIQVINLSNASDKKIKLRKDKINKKVKALDRNEIAVQTSRHEEEGKDKSIQVEISPERPSNQKNIPDPVNTSEKLEYVEPIVTIITHPDTPSNSDLSRRSIVINVGNGKIQVSSPSKSKDPSPKIRPLSSSGVESPTKELPYNSAPASRVTSPSLRQDSSSQDSLDINDSKRNHRQHKNKQKKYEKIKNNIVYENNSQASSSYASLAAIKPSSNLSVLSNITSILELLDLSTNDSIRNKFSALNISPVSTPETPSPRIMNVPSNIPCPERIAKILEFNDQVDTDDNTLSLISRMSECPCGSANCQQRKMSQDPIELSDYEVEQLRRYQQEQEKCIQKINKLDALIDQNRNQAETNFSTNLHNIKQMTNAVRNIQSKISSTVRENLNSNKVDPAFESTTPVTSPVQQKIKVKPKIISNEPANYDLSKFKKFKQSKDSKSVSNDDNMVAKLSQEILEQSKKVEGFKKPSPPKEGNDFVRMLADLPQVPMENGHDVEAHVRFPTRPVLPHDLSTIEELDTPDTGNQSQRSVRSPGKLIRVLSQSANTPQNRLVNGNDLNTKNNFGISDNLGQSFKDSEKELEKKSSNENNKLTPSSSSSSSLGILSIPTSNILTPDDHDNKSVVPFNKVKNSNKSSDSFLINCSTRNSIENIKSDKITSTTTTSSSHSFSGFSGISDILSTPVSVSDTDIGSPPEKMEDYLMGLGLAWLIPIARKTQQASALSSSSNSDITIALKRVKSPFKKSLVNGNLATNWTLPGFSDVSSISIKETTTNKSTEKTVLMKARTSTPNIPNFYSLSEKSSSTTKTTTTSTSSTGGFSLPEHSDSVIATNLSVYLKT